VPGALLVLAMLSYSAVRQAGGAWAAHACRKRIRAANIRRTGGAPDNIATAQVRTCGRLGTAAMAARAAIRAGHRHW